MRNELLIFHRGLKGSGNSTFLNEPGLARWTTCVRSLLIGSTQAETGQNHDHVYRGAEATQFLTNIVAGLESPMLGETEVHGQFKDFLGEMESQLPSELFVELMSVHFLARKVRSDYLRNLGCQSYGSFARKKMKEMRSLTILGAGQLAAEILPWLVKNRTEVNVVSRTPEAVPNIFREYNNVNVVGYNEVPDLTQGLIITAPLESEDILSFFSGDKPQLTLDFRAESRHDPLNSRFNSIALDDVFGEIESQKAQVEAQVQKAKSFIEESSRNLEAVVGRSLRSIKVS